MTLTDRLLEAFRWHEGHADVWPWFADAGLLHDVVAALAAPFADAGVTKIVSVEARGFLLGAPVAYALGAGFVAVRKDHALFAGDHVAATTLPDYRGRTYRLRAQRDALAAVDRAVIVDDWIETGNQTAPVRAFIEQAGAAYLGTTVIVDQLPVAVRRRLEPLHALLRADQLPPDIGN